MTNEEIGKEIKTWRDKIGFHFITPPDNDPICSALNLSGREVLSMSFDELGEHLIVLDRYYTFLCSEMGRIFSRVQFTGSSIERIKLNQIKPLTESIKVKIDLYKKIYDRKIKEAKWRAYDASSDRS